MNWRRTGAKSDFQQVKQLLHPLYVAVPVGIGLIVVGLLFYSEYKNFDLSIVNLTGKSLLFFLLAFFAMFGRDFGLTWRFHSLTDHEITWKQALRVNLLCEFTSAVTPSTVGGSSFGMIYLKGEGVNLGRATTIMMTTLFLDELFFVVSCPIVLLFVPFNSLFSSANAQFSEGLQLAFWIVYTGITLWTIILFWGIFIRPQVIKSVFLKIFSWRILRKWKSGAEEMGDNIIATSKALKQKRPFWWARVFFGTALSWASRYLVVNALFLAFGLDADQLLILVRQLVVWVVLTISPTPGGSGLGEWLFTEYYGDMVPSASLALLLALSWRFVSYYVYLIIGILLFPSWLKGWSKRARKARLNALPNADNK